MTTFSWTGRARDGRVVRGTRVASSPEAVAAMLRRERIVVTRVRMRRSLWTRRGVSSRELAVFTRQLAVMVEAGLPLVQCLDLLSRESENAALASLIRDVRHDVEHGAALAAALGRRPGSFGPLYVSMVAAGEAGGALDAILKRLAALLENEVRLASRLRSAMAYPAAVVVVAIVVVALVLWKVVPTFASLFQGLDATLPVATRLVIAASEASTVAVPAGALTCVAVAWAFQRYHGTVRGRLSVDKALLRIPVAGAIVRKVAVARFCRTLSTLVGAGVPILEGLDIAARTSGNAALERALADVRRRIEGGATIGQPLRATGVFPGMVAEMVSVGETTGTLDAMLARIADFYEGELEDDIASALTLVEPALIGVLGVVVGGIVVSMYLPLVELVGQLS